MLKKCPALWRDAHFQVKMLKTIHFWTTFGRTDVVSHGRRKGLCTLPKVSKTWWFRSSSKSVFVTYLKRICKDACCVAGAVQETHGTGMLGGPGADFLRRAAFWSIRSSGLLRWFCIAWQVQHFVWPGLTFSWQAQYFRQMEWKSRKTHWYEAVSFALDFSFVKEVSRNCFVFDVRFQTCRQIL